MPNTHRLTTLSVDEARHIRTLQLLVARAANQDSLAWWEDEALTAQGLYILERSTSTAPVLAARYLSIVAASARHKTAFAQSKQAIHLFHLDGDNEDGLALRDVSLIDIEVPADPIISMEALEQALDNLLGGIRPYTVAAREGQQVHISLPQPSSKVSPMVHRAETLACAYLQGEKGSPTFPYCLE